jgi:radical SAM superfamily enzyme YgiQ (UPF0313 family)
MDITFLAPTPPDISAFGVRSLSAYLRRAGYRTRIVFLPGSIGLLKEGGGFAYHYEQSTMDDIVELCRDATLVGVSFMSSYFDRAVQLTAALKRSVGGPVIWGGIHPSCKPEEALAHADMVCVGEGEEALAELLGKMRAGEEHRGLAGLWFRNGADIVRNPLRPLIRDLDTLPHVDFSNEEHFIYDLDTRRIVPLTDALLKRALPLLPSFGRTSKRAFRTMTDRGCPHRCAYCNVSNLRAMYQGDPTPYLRSRSVGDAVDELEAIRRRFPFVEAIQFFDDTFFARPAAQIREFSRLYRERIGLPFYCQASPTTLTEEKLVSLIDAGLVYVEMGIQTGSRRIKELYHRTESNEKILEGADILHRHRDRLLRPDYHVIIDNPWETESDTYETVKLLFRIPKPFGLCISSLVFFPQTELYNKALAEGLLRDEVADIYRKPFYVPPKRTYVNFLIYLLTFQHFPRWLLAWLVRERTVRFFSGRRLAPLYGVLYRLGEAVRFLGRGFDALRRGDWNRIRLFLRETLTGDRLVAGRKS